MARASLTDSLATNQKQIDSTQKQISAWNGPGYLGTLTKVLDASYGNNKDLIDYRQAARSQLYGNQTPYQPANYGMLSPDQQASITNAPRAGLISGIQAANETQAARGNNVADVLKAENDRLSAQRDSLYQTLQQLNSRRGEMEGRVKTIEKNGVIETVDPITGQVLSRVDTGLRDYHPGSGGGNGTPKSKLKIPNGYDVKLQHKLSYEEFMNERQGMGQTGQDAQVAWQQYNADPASGTGVDYFGPKGKLNAQQWSAETGVNPWEAAQTIGSRNQVDWSGTTTGQRLDTPANPSDEFNTDKQAGMPYDQALIYYGKDLGKDAIDAAYGKTKGAINLTAPKKKGV